MKLWNRLFLITFLCVLGFQGCRFGAQDGDLPVGFKNADELRSYFQWSPDRRPLISAHRGGPVTGYPENAIRTFQHSFDVGANIIECDIRQTKDGHLVLMHDKTLDRTTTGRGDVVDYTLEELKRLELVDIHNTPTGDKIPTLEETCDWARNKAVLHLDIKDRVEPSLVISEIRNADAEGFAIVIVYNYENMMEYHHLNSELMLSVSAGTVESVQKLKEYDIPMENVQIFVGVSEPDPEVYTLLHDEKRYCILGTMHNLDNKAIKQGVRVYQELFRNGADILSTDNVDLAVEAVQSM
jgi:glycerophosphoryl diester phosphodiesterase